MRKVSLTFILEIISSIIMIISYILGIIQSFNNYYFKHCKTIKTTTERLLFEQFSYEVYSNIKSYPFTTVNSDVISKQDYIGIEFKGNSFYDCKGVFDGELNEKYCQNKVISGNTCCRPECCIRTNDESDNLFCFDYVFDEIPKNNRILLYNDDEILEDPRNRFCTYYNSYSETRLKNYLYKYKFNYEDILSGSQSPKICIGRDCTQKDIDCGIIDTKYNHLYTTDSTFCPINEFEFDQTDNTFHYYSNNDIYNSGNKIIIRNIISGIPPDIHEWKGYKVSDEYIEEKNKITIKDINKLLKNQDSSKIYEKYQNEFNLNDLGISIYNRYKSKKYYYYTTNYIGFSNYTELKKFKEKFDENDYRNNPLYKIGEEIYPSVESIVIGFLLMSSCIAYLIILGIYLLKNFDERKKFLKILYIIKQILHLLSFLEELGMYIWMRIKFKSINIDMDDLYKEILDFYNKRSFQLCFLLSIIFLFLALLLSDAVFIIYKETKIVANISNTEAERIIPFTNNTNNSNERNNLINNNNENINNENINNENINNENNNIINNNIINNNNEVENSRNFQPGQFNRGNNNNPDNLQSENRKLTLNHNNDHNHNHNSATIPVNSDQQ